MKDKKQLFLAILLLVVLCVGAWFLYQNMMPKEVEGEKIVTVQVVHGDGSEKSFTCETKATYLGEMLLEQGMVKGTVGQYGMFITEVDSEIADDAKQQWWCLTKKGELVNTSADLTPIENGEIFELTLTEGY